VTSAPRVLVLHNRYRLPGGEERAVELHTAALSAAGIAHELLEADSSAAGPARAASALLAGGGQEREVDAAVRSLGATVAHVHNMQPLLGPRALAAARAAGARVVITLHNFRLFCAIAVAFRDGEPCFRCRGRMTLPGLALNCRGSLPEAAAYAVGLSAHLPAVLDAVDAFVAPSHHAAGQLARLGVPARRLHVVPHYLPEEAIAARSRAGDGRFVLYAGRLSEEKGVAVAVEAAVHAGVPLVVAGEGPLEGELRERAAGARPEAVTLLGRVDRPRLGGLLAEAAAVVVPSLWDETFGYAALEAMAAGVPVVASRTGALPEVVGEANCVPRGDARALASALRDLWEDPARREAEGDALIARARERFGRERHTERLLAVYAAVERG